MINKPFFVYLILAAFFIVGVGLRLYNLDSLPSEMHRDEVSIGYNAFSILKTGKDEYGVAWPLVYKSFGDYKLPGMLYAVTASVKVFGLTPFAVRLPTALIASLLIPVSFLLAQELWGERRRSLLVSSMVTIAQWHTFLARTAYEPMMALTLFVLALVCVLKARRARWWFGPALLFFGLSFLTYNVPLLLTPLIIVALLGVYRVEYWQKSRATGSFLIALAILWLSCSWLLSSATGGKLKATILADDKIQAQSQQFAEGMMLGGVPYRLTQLFVSPWVFTGQAFIKNYLSAFDPSYLFFEGGVNPWHSLGVLNLGNFNLALLPMVMLSVYLLSRKKVSIDTGSQFILLYLLLTPLPDAMTIDAPVTNRLLDFHLALLLFASISMWWLVERSRFSRLSQAILVIILSGTAGYFLIFWSRYATIHSRTLDSLWYEGIGETAAAIPTYLDEVDRVYLDLNQIDAHQLTHLYFAFYGQYDPVKYQSSAVYTLDDKFSTTLSFDPYYFVDTPEKLDFGSNYERFFPEGVDTALFVVRLVNEPPRTDAERVVFDNWQRQPLWQLVILTKADLDSLASP